MFSNCKELFDIFEKFVHTDVTKNDLSDDELKELIIKYYDLKTPVKELKKEYRLESFNMAIHKTFPTFSSNILCPNCQLNLTVEWIDRANKNMFLVVCYKCGHIHDNQKCDCRSCMKDSGISENHIVSESLSDNQISEDIINNLKLRDYLILSSILRVYDDYPMRSISIPLEKLEIIFPTMQYGMHIMDDLIQRKIFVLESLDTVTIIKGKLFFGSKFTAESNIRVIKILKDLSYKILYDYEKYDKLNLWNELAVKEITQYYEYNMSKMEIKHEVELEEVLLFQDLLRNFSVAQIWGIISKAIAFVTKQYEDGGISKDSITKRILFSCEQNANRAISSNWILPNYYRPFEVPSSILCKIFYNELLGIGELGILEKPSLEFIK